LLITSSQVYDKNEVGYFPDCGVLGLYYPAKVVRREGQARPSSRGGASGFSPFDTVTIGRVRRYRRFPGGAIHAKGGVGGGGGNSFPTKTKKPPAFAGVPGSSLRAEGSGLHFSRGGFMPATSEQNTARPAHCYIFVGPGTEGASLEQTGWPGTEKGEGPVVKNHRLRPQQLAVLFGRGKRHPGMGGGVRGGLNSGGASCFGLQSRIWSFARPLGTNFAGLFKSQKSGPFCNGHG